MFFFDPLRRCWLCTLLEKIAIPNDVKLHCVSWNREQGWIATGGDDGLLKVLKLETPTNPEMKLKGIAAQSNLSMNQTLEGHSRGVMCVAWNPQHRKLTTSDAAGLIIVWMLHKGSWHEEMINNRNKSVVRDMKWTADGKKICIVYEDGAVIVGSVGGDRLWGKELNLPLRFVEWSPDGRLILFVTMDAEIWVFDSDGNKLRSMSLSILDARDEDSLIAAIHWFCPPGGVSSSSRNRGDPPPTLCVALENGLVQLSRNDEDSRIITFDTELQVSYCRWDSSGGILAVTGTTAASGTSKDSTKKSAVNVIKFYDNNGNYLRYMRVPGESVSAMAWEGSGLRLSLVVDSFIFFANVRPAYRWAYLLNTVVFTYQRGYGDKRDSHVVFWDQTTGDSHVKQVGKLIHLAASGDYCALVVLKEKSNDSKSAQEKVSSDGNMSGGGKTTAADGGVRSGSLQSRGSPGESHSCVVELRNTIGAIVDSRILPFTPKRVTMGQHHFAAVSDRCVYTWQFVTETSRRLEDAGGRSREGLQGSGGAGGGDQASSGASRGRERMFDIENLNFSSAQAPETFQKVEESTKDPITALTVSDRFLVIGRKTGVITRYVLPHLSPENTYQVASEPYRLDLNCTSSKLSIIDKSGVFSIIDMEVRDQADAGVGLSADAVTEGKKQELSSSRASYSKLSIERRDVWDVKWAEDNDEMVAIMEKTKMTIFRGETSEEPVVSAGYLARFRDLEVRVVLLDELTQHPDPPNKACVIDHESRLLREAREEIISSGTSGGYSYIEKNPHPRLWRLLANKSLEDLDLGTAERAFVHCKDYYGVQLVKQLRSMPDKMKARAEVAVYMGKYDEAESIYREIDRKDLAIKFRRRIGDHMRVVQLLQTGGGNDKHIKDAWDRIGQYFTDRFKWRKAVQYYQLSRNVEKLAECHYRLENFGELAKLRHDVADGTDLLKSLAKQFECVGMYDEAIDCFVRSGDTKSAVDCCVKLNRWDSAIDLAEKYDYPQVEGLLTKYALSLTTKGRHLEAVELYRRANRPTEAALLIGEIAEKAANEDVKPSLAKKLHILAALEIERHRKKTMDLATQATLNAGGDGVTAAQTTMATLETLMMTTLDTQAGGTTQTGNKKASKAFGNAWRGAAAYHYYMLAHRQLYGGRMDAAMKTSIKLCEYDDILEPRNIYSLLCITSLKNNFFGICSKAFVKLETLEVIDAKDLDDIQTLAVKIFVTSAPADPSPLPEPYIKCLDLGKTFKACTISGRAILDSEAITCSKCRHSFLEHERAQDIVNCPLCHHLL